jgi:hypothetical protein
VWTRVRVVSAVAAATLLLWMTILFTDGSTITLRGDDTHPSVDLWCAPVVAYIYQNRHAIDTSAEFDPTDGICDRQRTAKAGLIGLLAVPTMALAWLSTQRRRPPSRQAVIRAASAWNAGQESGGTD